MEIVFCVCLYVCLCLCINIHMDMCMYILMQTICGHQISSLITLYLIFLRQYFDELGTSLAYQWPHRPLISQIHISSVLLLMSYIIVPNVIHGCYGWDSVSHGCIILMFQQNHFLNPPWNIMIYISAYEGFQNLTNG